MEECLPNFEYFSFLLSLSCKEWKNSVWSPSFSFLVTCFTSYRTFSRFVGCFIRSFLSFWLVVVDNSKLSYFTSSLSLFLSSFSKQPPGYFGNQLYPVGLKCMARRIYSFVYITAESGWWASAMCILWESAHFGKLYRGAGRGALYGDGWHRGRASPEREAWLTFFSALDLLPPYQITQVELSLLQPLLSHYCLIPKYFQSCHVNQKWAERLDNYIHPLVWCIGPVGWLL